MNRMRLAFCVLVSCGLSVPGAAQDERAIPVVTTAAPVEKVRFAGSPSSVLMRIEVRSAGGVLVYDSDWKDGNLLDWLPQDSSGQPLTNGVYRLVMRSKNLAGQTSEKEASLRVDSGGMAVDGQPSVSPKITLTAHDGETGQLITTSGDLSFRFGDFLNRRDTEVMRLTAAGELNVNGLIRANGIMFSDGTVLTTAAGLATAGDSASVMRQRPSAPEVKPPILPLNTPTLSLARPAPRPNAGPANQFVVDSAGVHIGTTSAYGLDVAGNVGIGTSAPSKPLDVVGDVNASTGFDIAGLRVLSSSSPNGNLFVGAGTAQTGTSNTFIGAGAGSVNTGTLNTFIGFFAGGSNLGGFNNTFVGTSAGQFNSSGDGNTLIGLQAGPGLGTGAKNTLIGYYSGPSFTGESFNTMLGFYADGSAGITNATAIGTKAKATQSNTVVLGSINGVNGATATASVGIGTSAPQQMLGVAAGMDIDQGDANNGTLAPGLIFGFGSGEGIASKRTATGNQYGLDFYTNFATRMSVAQFGNVGIGTKTPITLLHIQKDNAGALGPSITLMNGGGAAGAGTSVDFDGYDPGANAPSARIESLDDGNFSSHFLVLTKNPGMASNALVERMRITSDGRMGVGTSTPNQMLGVGNNTVGGGITVDEGNTFNGTLTTTSNGVLAFGAGASNVVGGEAIASKRTVGGNFLGLDFYTNYTSRMNITQSGNVNVVGNLTKGTGSFKIDHPLDPENKYLYHSFVESPDMMNIYNGVVTVDSSGEAIVQLPEWFEALNQDFRYQLTCLHGFAPVYIDEEISENRFKIAGGKPGMKVSWQVTGIRHDAYADAHRIQVEEDKPAAERGTYLHPTEYGQPKERGIR